MRTVRAPPGRTPLTPAGVVGENSISREPIRSREYCCCWWPPVPATTRPTSPQFRPESVVQHPTRAACRRIGSCRFPPRDVDTPHEQPECETQLADERRHQHPREQHPAGERCREDEPPGGAAFSRKQLDELSELVKPYGAPGVLWLRRTADGYGSPAAKALGDKGLGAFLAAAGAGEDDLLLAVGGAPKVVGWSDGPTRAARRVGVLPTRVGMVRPPAGDRRAEPLRRRRWRGGDSAAAGRPRQGAPFQGGRRGEGHGERGGKRLGAARGKET